jgi:hypothetical protein
VNLSVSSRSKLPIRVTLASGPSGTSTSAPHDLQVGANPGGSPGGPFVWSGYVPPTIAPIVGDTYTFDVLYGDGTGETLSAAVTGLLPVPANLAPQDAGSSVPTFSWTPPSTGEPFAQGLDLFSSGGTFIWSESNFSSSTSSLVYDFDQRALQSSLTPGTTYNWSVQASDVLGNSSSTQVSFTAQ